MKINSLLEILRNPEIYKFLIVGVFGTILVLSLTLVFTTFLGLYYVISAGIAYEITIIVSFIFNDRWTFSKVKKTSKSYHRLIKYNSFYLIGLGITQLIMIVLTEYFGFYYIVGESIGVIMAFFFNFFASKKITFKK